MPDSEQSPSRFRVLHRTTYRYRQPVHLNAHKVIMRPRDSVDLTIKLHKLTVSPCARLQYASDVHGNTIATAWFEATSDSLIIEACTEVERFGAEWPVFNIDASVLTYPFKYSQDDFMDLGPLNRPQYPDLENRLGNWARAFVAGRPTDTLLLLQALSAGVSDTLSYQIREYEGTQDPITSLSLGTGTCRDYAVLFAEAARTLGFGCRVVSGYVFLPNAIVGKANCSTTHAWAQVFLPGAGWITFDPTNRRMGDYNLIPVAVGTDINRVMPVTGTFAGPEDALLDMNVEVEVTSAD